MNIIFEVSDGGQDGTDGSVLCHVSNSNLATKVSLNRGTMGVGPGPVREIKVYDSFEELPVNIRSYIVKSEVDLSTKKEKEIQKFLNSLSLEEKQDAFNFLKSKI